jgi:tellurite resistance protein TerC
MAHETVLWIVFAIIVPVVLVLDLAVFQRRAHTIKTKEALLMTVGYMSLALLFAVAVYFMLGRDKSFTFLTGYIVEQSLSMDNLFVFLMIFTSFAVPSEYQHRVLFWGIVGAVVMRGAFIGSGWALLNALHWIIYVFGAFLLYTGIKIATKKDEEVNPKKNLFFRLCTKYLPMTDDYRGGKFFTRENGRSLATPLLLVLVVVETTDIVFATDSIPAILSITPDLFLIYTSNIFAILGLRALYFAIAGVTKKLAYFNYGLAAILSLLGVKMLISSWVEVPIPVSLGSVVGILGIATLVSFLWPPKKKGILSKDPGDDSKK